MSFRRAAIILFCLWHMAAVGVYSIPAEAEDRVSMWLKDTGIPIVRPYLFLTSQWQQWNLFAPDPIRRVTFFTITIDRKGSPKEIVYLDPEHLPWWKDGDELKILRRLEEADYQWEGLRMKYLEVYCRMHDVPQGSTITLGTHGYVIPRPAVPMSAAYWRTIGPALAQAQKQQSAMDTSPVKNISSFSYDVTTTLCP